jgi:tetratricopeptide (TPR) repeat protein
MTMFTSLRASAALAALTFLLAAAGTADAQRPPFIVGKRGDVIEVDRLSARSDGTLTARKGNVTRNYGPDQYAKAVGEKPPEIDQAARLAAQKKFDEAIELLEQVVRGSRFLTWDLQAMKFIGQVQNQKGDHQEAVRVIDKLLERDEEYKSDPEAMQVYWEALMGTENYSKLLTSLDEAIANAPRELAARAQIMRGNVKLQRQQYQDAVLDYLRTVVFFKEQKEAMAEALRLTASTMEKMRDPRAEEFRKLAQEVR